ncbi:MAG: hypothetical protein ACD_52C00088G0005 [uncultured bacterium]|uniref:GHMP kinase n=1 Tax=Candidatus Woesebacteria bacterium RIFCSPHIGHO2_12_FULL_41_24 TaxID=1802510 RepID=A0A1F8AST2_9BACT|nr:MAG: hypothetical protein ACD_52C00088G0005 [uncultured bacterium]OGM15001.1 MAG: GHMP kinase [Candidatus Woesebacteria bacterium RBG_16_41_13]OGM30000.1 MAG: GHMP kinase [Candidatus Woesebacteria bacterium RIFCSPHIGHO2_01_FULL_42_80]OGM35078.1 MAG: GHMP kinase [Candidatus Woesebacteria bacterium RIFCSPHIGHO2_02_FULL_42_20]OGM54814.1 MAG: GHMP kinase [Candidatus Woesebacteria bacterium RIFCSPHIGHO2_12_FULL_41_24]OGM67430.1 MAG: GHMP kinase [Candidatus Woesebacteria bacterium RIFCSPLOWO2_01_
MIISKTPLRISFVGGGTDIPWFYKKYPGAVVSTAIDKFVYITVNKKFDQKVRVSYSKTEIVDKVEQIKHELVREALKLTKIGGGIEITSISDIPSEGTGLGSSSSYTVGLLNALYAFKGKHVGVQRLASEASRIEIDILGKPVGKQDQYIAAQGGLQHIKFNRNGSVFIDPIILPQKLMYKLQSNLLMLYTGLTRSSSSVLKKQKSAVIKSPKKLMVMQKMADMATDTKHALEKGKLNDFGELLHQNWLLKRQLANGISNSKVDKWYLIARRLGAIGGKICGAGGGGFLLLFAPGSRHAGIISALKDLKKVDFNFEAQGSQAFYV